MSPPHGSKLPKHINISSIGKKERFQLMEMIERRCLDLSQQLYSRYLTDATIQKEIAYAVIVTARKENLIQMADSKVFRKLYGIEIRNER